MVNVTLVVGVFFAVTVSELDTGAPLAVCERMTAETVGRDKVRVWYEFEELLVTEADVDNENDPMLGIVSLTVLDRICVPVACDSDDVPELRPDIEALSVIVGNKALRV
jgi:hypothetical protein